jgi:hypothetical protein
MIVTRRPLARHPLLWALLGFAGLLIVLAATFVAAVPLSSESFRHRIVRALSEKFDSDVELGDLHLHVFPGLRAEGVDLRVRRRGMGAYPPLISVKSFHVDANLVGLWRQHVDRVQLDGLEISIPPREARARQERAEERSKGGRQTSRDDQRSTAETRNDPLKDGGVVIDRVDADDARVVILPFSNDKEPKVWAIHQLLMHEVGSTRPWPFEATVTNGVPPGEIDVSGTFGPWHRDEPGDTSLEGAFVFEKADLGVFKGISGTLSSRGTFGGTLAAIEAKGETDTPDFTIAVGGHAFPLHVDYQALIDGTNGDTRLTVIDAWFLGSGLHATGAVLGAPKGQHGRTITLDVAMDRSRIEDIMTMVVPTATPPIVGRLTLRTTFVLPPGRDDVAERLRLDGRFTLSRARFTNDDVQRKIEGLSRRGRLKTPAPKQERVVSDFQGRFTLANGRLVLPGVTFAVPGARVELAGTYALKAEAIDFKGHLLLDANVSQTTTGWKSLVLKTVDPVFRQKDGTGSAIPIMISGTRKAPEFGLDLRRVFKRKGDP